MSLIAVADNYPGWPAYRPSIRYTPLLIWSRLLTVRTVICVLGTVLHTLQLSKSVVNTANKPLILHTLHLDKVDIAL